MDNHLQAAQVPHESRNSSSHECTESKYRHQETFHARGNSICCLEVCLRRFVINHLLLDVLEQSEVIGVEVFLFFDRVEECRVVSLDVEADLVLFHQGRERVRIIKLDFDLHC